MMAAWYLIEVQEERLYCTIIEDGRTIADLEAQKLDDKWAILSSTHAESDALSEWIEASDQYIAVPQFLGMARRLLSRILAGEEERI